MDIVISFNLFNTELSSISLTEKVLINNVSNQDSVRFLKGMFTNKERFNSRFIAELRKVGGLHDEFNCNDWLDSLLEIYDMVEPFTYEEAFKLQNQQFQALVFGSIDIAEMIKSLGCKRISTEGRPVKHKIFSDTGGFLGMREYDVIYEVYEVDGTKLKTGSIYALKCWCTSTNKEHWIWISDKYKDKPLEAVASTFMIHKNLIPYIKEIKRQGDLLFVEMDEKIKPEGDVVSLTADQYFSLLTCQS